VKASWTPCTLYTLDVGLN